MTKKSVNNVVEEISMVLDGLRKPRVSVVDWLGRLDKDGRLDKILALLGKACHRLCSWSGNVLGRRLRR